MRFSRIEVVYQDSRAESVEAVVMLNSSVGLHAFLFDKPVIVLGQAYWSFKTLPTQVKCAEALYETFSRPTKLDCNETAHSDFMNYLVSEYLFGFPDGDMGKHFQIAAA